MSIGQLCSNTIMMIQQDDSIQHAAKLMHESNIGALVVVDNKDQYPIPRGIITDRDIITRLLSPDANINAVRVSDVMSADLFTVRQEQGIKEVIKEMSSKKVRRAPVVDQDGRLVGMVTVDDLIMLLADEIHALSSLLRNQLNVKE